MINAFSAKQSMQINLKIKCNKCCDKSIHSPQFNGRNPKGGEGEGRDYKNYLNFLFLPFNSRFLVGEDKSGGEVGKVWIIFEGDRPT